MCEGGREEKEGEGREEKGERCGCESVRECEESVETCVETNKNVAFQHMIAENTVDQRQPETNGRWIVQKARV